MQTAKNRLRRFQRQRLLALADFASSTVSMPASTSGRCGLSCPSSTRATRPSSNLNHATERARGPVELLVVGDLASRRKGVDIAIDALRLAPELDCRLTVVGGARYTTSSHRRMRPTDASGSRGAVARRVRRLIHAGGWLPLPDPRRCLSVSSSSRRWPPDWLQSRSRTRRRRRPCGRRGNCLIVDSHDPVDWAAAIERLVEDQQLRSQLGDARPAP